MGRREPTGAPPDLAVGEPAREVRERLAPNGANFCRMAVAGYHPAIPSFPKGAADHVSFHDATAELGLPTDLHSMTASLGDVNADGGIDLLVWEKDPKGVREVYVLCGGRYVPLGLAGRIDGDLGVLDSGATASVIRDINGDGRADLVVGLMDQRLLVLTQTEQLRFTAQTWKFDEPTMLPPRVSTIAPVDLDGDGRLDLYLAMRYKVDQVRFDAHVYNPVLIQQPDGTFVDRARSPEFLPIYDCGDALTCGVDAIVAPRPKGEKRYLWIGNVNNMSCAFEYSSSKGHVSFVQLAMPLGKLGMVITMGLEDALADDTANPLFTESDWGHRAPTFLITDGSPTTSVHDRTESVVFDPLPQGTGNLIGWGLARRDFDNDGAEDLIIANGSYYTPEFEQKLFAGALVIGKQYLKIYHNDGRDRLVDASSTAGPAFNIPASSYSIAVADINRDGCYDLVVTPKDLANALGEDDHDVWNLPVRVLLNDCAYPNDRIGLVLPEHAAAVAIEARVPIPRSKGKLAKVTKYRAVKVSPGVASSSDRRLMVVGLGRGAVVDAVTVTLDVAGVYSSFRVDGAALEMNTYNRLLPTPP